MRKTTYKFFGVLIFGLILAGCQSVTTFHGPDLYLKAPPRPPQEPPVYIQRTADMPLVAAIPGLNVPFAPQGSFQFGKLTEMLDAENIPSMIIGYDDAVHPLTEVADLFSDQYSIAITRILPHLTHAIEKENDIRKEQGAPPLKELDIIGYSQGSVLAVDLIMRLIRFREEYHSLQEAAGDEWEFFLNDPELLLFQEVAKDYSFIKNIRIQRQKQFDKDYDFHEFYERLVERLAKAYERFQTYLDDPEKVYPHSSVFKGKKKGYPRHYPKIFKWFQENYSKEDSGDLISLDFMMKYFEYDRLIPLDMRFFSMSGSFFGSPEANKAYGMLKVLPIGVDKFVVGPDTQQIKQTRLGSRHHLKIIKDLLNYADKKGGFQKQAENVYFIVGPNGEKGDGLVGQSSAHFSAHLLSQIPVEELLAETDEKYLTLETRRLPVYQITGLKVRHLPGRRFFFFKTPGVAEMSPESKVFPFLSAFLKKDFKKLGVLHNKENQKLRQFMVELDLPYTDDLKGYDFTLRPKSPGVAITGRYFNSGSNTVVWTGVFKSKKHFFDFETIQLKGSGEVILKGTKPFSKTVEVKLNVDPGTNHFIEVTSEKEVAKKAFNLAVPNLFSLVNKNNFVKMMSGEK